MGLVSERDELKHRMIQILCVEPTSHSGMIGKLQINDEDFSLVDEIIKEIAELKQSTKSTSKMVLALKDGMKNLTRLEKRPGRDSDFFFPF